MQKKGAFYKYIVGIDKEIKNIEAELSKKLRTLKNAQISKS